MILHYSHVLLLIFAVYTASNGAVNQNETDSSSEWDENEALEDEEKEESQIIGAPSELLVMATHDSVQVSWLPPRDDNVLIRGYLIGWGINIPDVEKATVDPEARHFTIRGLKPNREYVISLRAFNKIGHGFPIYETVKTSSYGVHSSKSASISDPKSTFAGFGGQQQQPPSNSNGLSAPVGVVAETVSSSQIRLSWADPNENAFNQMYTIKYGISNSDESQHKQLNITETEHIFDGLRPDTLYEFAVRLVQSSHWSLNALNRTHPAPPSSPPRDLTVIGPQFNNQHENADPGTITLTWQPPKYANGEIQEYIMLFSDRPHLPDRDWSMDSVKGDRLSIELRNLRPRLTYHFKLQARNVKGYGPFTPVTSVTTADTFTSNPTSNGPRNSVNAGSNSEAFEILMGQFLSGLRSNLVFVLIGIVVAVVVLLLFIALCSLCFYHNKNSASSTAAAANRPQQRSKKEQRNKRSKHHQQAYIPGRKMSVSTPSAVAELDDDLWLVHQQRNSAANPGGARFATIVNASNVDGYGSSVDDETGILLIDGQQRAFFAPANAAGGPNFQSAQMECTTPKHYQQNAYHAATQRHGRTEDREKGISVGGGEFYGGGSLMESFHSMTTVGDSPKSSNKSRKLHRNSLPPHICPSNSTTMSPPFATINKSPQPNQHWQHNCHAFGKHDHFGIRGGTQNIAETKFGRRSDSPYGTRFPCQQGVAGIRTHCCGHLSSLNALDLSISPRLGHTLRQTNGPNSIERTAALLNELDEKHETVLPLQRFRVGIGLPSMPLQVKQAKRKTTAHYEATTAVTRKQAAPTKSVNFASKLVIVSSDDDDNGGYNKWSKKTKRQWNGSKDDKGISFIDNSLVDDVDEDYKYANADTENRQQKETEIENANTTMKKQQRNAADEKLNGCDDGSKNVPPPSVVDLAMDSVETLPRGQSNRYHLYNSSASLEMNSVPQPLHIHQQQQHQQQQVGQQQHLGGTPLTPRNAHVVYTRVDRQPIAKMDFTVSGSAVSNGVVGPPHDSPHNLQQRHQFSGTVSASGAGGTPPLPPPPSLTAANRGITTAAANVQQYNRNDSNGYQTVGGRANAAGGAAMLSFVNGTTADGDDGKGGNCDAAEHGVTSAGEHQQQQAAKHQHHQQQRMAHIVRPIVYVGGGGGVAGGASPSPSTIRSATGQSQAQKTTPTSVHKFAYNNNGAKVPVGRAMVQPRVNLAVSSSNAIATPYGCSSSSSQYASVRVNPSNAGSVSNNAIIENDESEVKTVGSTKDLQEIDQMIETLQQLQHDFTGGDNASAS